MHIFTSKPTAARGVCLYDVNVKGWCEDYSVAARETVNAITVNVARSISIQQPIQRFPCTEKETQGKPIR